MSLKECKLLKYHRPNGLRGIEAPASAEHNFLRLQDIGQLVGVISAVING